MRGAEPILLQEGKRRSSADGTSFSFYYAAHLRLQRYDPENGKSSLFGYFFKLSLFISSAKRNLSVGTTVRDMYETEIDCKLRVAGCVFGGCGCA